MFIFLKYLQPNNYYNLVQSMPQAVLYNEDSNFNTVGYSNEQAEIADRNYYYLQNGFVPVAGSTASDIQQNEIKNIKDNYLFVRRYFSTFQLLRVLILRIITLSNPIKELVAFFYCLKNKRIFIIPNGIRNYGDFDSELLNLKPLISIIIPTLNRYEYLKDVLLDLEKQDYQHFEVIICDQSEPIDREFYTKFKLDIKLIEQNEKALWKARNACIVLSKSDFILMFDDDSRVNSHWISNHLRCLDYFGVKISAGVTNTIVGGGMGVKENYFHLSDVFDTGNALVHRSVFENVGLFDRQFEKQRMGDSEFGLRALLGGHNIISNPLASRIHLKVETGGLRQMGSWDAIRPKKLFAPRPIPSVLYLIRKYYGDFSAILYIIQTVPQSFVPYRFKGKKSFKIFFSIFFSIWFPIALIGTIKSWRESTLKLAMGSKIDFLN